MIMHISSTMDINTQRDLIKTAWKMTPCKRCDHLPDEHDLMNREKSFNNQWVYPCRYPECDCKDLELHSKFASYLYDALVKKYNDKTNN